MTHNIMDQREENQARLTMPPTRRVTIYGNLYQDSHLDSLASFFRLLGEKNIDYDIEETFGRYLADKGVIDDGVPFVATLPRDCGAIICIGGDGTFLHAALWAGSSETPILGINTGHLGFLASYMPDDASQLADALVGGKLIEERRAMLHLSGDCVPDDFWPYALNEVAVMKADTSSMIRVSVEADGFFLTDYLADGLVVATPTGSTAYSLSGGGPIVQPTMDCITLTPIAPHTLTLRPIVVSGDTALSLTGDSRAQEFRVSVDGRSFVAPVGSRLTLRRAPFRSVILRRPDDDYASILRRKLLWGRR